ncbi:MAG: hypothetical protein HKN98_00860 [Silicimonas sp.]|nr:hypothetical protein [Silicimonas sp.]
MALSYDFDMHSVMPTETLAKSGDKLGDSGTPPDMLDQNVALFRDPVTADALRGASEAIRKCFVDSGFGLNVYDSGAGPGRFPASDGPERSRVIERLMTNLEALPDGLDWNSFDIEGFAMSALNAKPLDTSAQSLRQMRAEAPPDPGPQNAAGDVDRFFSNAAPTAPKATPASGSGAMDDFFTAAPTGTRAQVAPPEPRPDMDAFFSNTAGAAATAPVSRTMTAEDIRMTIDTAPPKKIGLGPVKMMLMAVGLFFAITFLANGDGASKLVEVATGQMEALNR